MGLATLRKLFSVPLGVSISSPSGEGGGFFGVGREDSLLAKGVSISSPSGEGGGKMDIDGKVFSCDIMFPLVLLQVKAVGCGTTETEYCTLETVSISSPSGEGGGKRTMSEEFLGCKSKFPLVLLQVKAVGEKIIVVLSNLSSFPLVLLHLKEN
mgnify:FL=1